MWLTKLNYGYFVPLPSAQIKQATFIYFYNILYFLV